MSKIQKVSHSSFGWCSRRIIVIPTSQGEMDVHIPNSEFIGENGNLIHTASFDGDDVIVESNEDYTYGKFPNSRRTDPEKKIVFLAQKVGEVWEIKKNHLPPGSVKPTPQTYWDKFGRWNHGTL